MQTLNETTRCQCPVCGAQQDWSAQCRRCTADLRLVREVATAANDAHRKCLLGIAQGQNQEALKYAETLVRLRPDERANKLLAVCHLLCHNFAAATSLAR